jgi:hypothetical protein
MGARIGNFGRLRPSTVQRVEVGAQRVDDLVGGRGIELAGIRRRLRLRLQALLDRLLQGGRLAGLRSASRASSSSLTILSGEARRA